jgi:hypothetical protein
MVHICMVIVYQSFCQFSVERLSLEYMHQDCLALIVFLVDGC